MVGKGFGQAAVHGEGTTPFAVLLSVGDEGRILIEPVHDGFEETVLDVVHLHLGHRLSFRIQVEAALAGDGFYARVLFHRVVDLRFGIAEGIHAAVGEHHVAQELILFHEVHARRYGLIDGQFVHLKDDLLHLGLDLVQVFLFRHTGLDQLAAESEDAVFGFPGGDFLFGPIRALVGRRVTAVAVGNHVQQARAFFFLQQGFLAAESVDDGQRIVAIHALSMPGFRIETGAQAGREGVAHGLAAGLATHRILVVHYVDEHRQAAFHVSLPEGLELVHGSEGHAFQDRTAGHGAVTQVGDDDALLPVDLLIQGRTYGDGAAAAHDGVVRIDAKRGEEGMHRSAQTLVETGRAGENLGDGTVDQEADTELFGRALEAFAGNGNGCTAPELVHDFLQLLVGEDFDGTQALGEDLTVAAVAAEDKVVRVQVVGHTHSGGFLAGAQVGRTRIVIGHAVVAARGLDEIQHRLELTDGEHVAIDVQQIFLGEILFFQFIRNALLVLHHGDLRELDFVFLRTADLIRVDIQ